LIYLPREVSEGVVGTLLEIFGVSKRFDRQVTLFQGPNRRSNRYLTYQYTRLIKSLHGTMVKGASTSPSHVVWEYNFYKLSDPEFLIDTDKKLPAEGFSNKWVPISEHLKHLKEVKNDCKNQERFRKLTSREKKIFRGMANKYWAIANQLVRDSVAFRMAVMKKAPLRGKTY
jgi:hypothetical protein